MRSMVLAVLTVYAALTDTSLAQRALLEGDAESGCMTLIRNPAGAARHVVDIDVAIEKQLVDAPLSISERIDLQIKAMRAVAEKSKLGFDKIAFDEANSQTDPISRSVQVYATGSRDKQSAALLFEVLQLRISGKAVDSCFEEPASTGWTVVP